MVVPHQKRLIGQKRRVHDGIAKRPRFKKPGIVVLHRKCVGFNIFRSDQMITRTEFYAFFDNVVGNVRKARRSERFRRK